MFVDGHTDFYQPYQHHGEGRFVVPAFATGPDLAPDAFDGYRPLVRDADVVVLVFRDADEAASYGSQLPPPDMRTIDLAEVRRSGIEATAREAVDRLSRNGLAGFWVHLDADVLDDGVMPAVDYRLPDGLSFYDLEIILQMALNSHRAVGVEITVFNPHLDPDGAIARSLVDTLVRSMTNSLEINR